MTSFEDEINPVAAVTFLREVSLRYRRPRRVAALNPITAPAKAAEFMRRLLPDNVREHFLALFLDGRNAVASYYVAATGTANSCPVGVRESIKPPFCRERWASSSDIITHPARRRQAGRTPRSPPGFATQEPCLAFRCWTI